MFIRFAQIASAALLVSMGGPASAVTVEPVVSVITIPDDLSGVTIVVENPRNVDFPFVVEIVERAINEDGTEEQTPADGEFVVFPPQAIVAPGQSRSLRLQWVGAVPETSRSFTLYASELPVELSGEPSGIQTLLRMGASVHVVPPGARGQPVVINAEIVPEGVMVTLGNEGTRYVYINELSLSFNERIIEGVELGNTAGRTLITPGAKRTFLVEGVASQPRVSELQ